MGELTEREHQLVKAINLTAKAIDIGAVPRQSMRREVLNRYAGVEKLRDIKDVKTFKKLNRQLRKIIKEHKTNE